MEVMRIIICMWEGQIGKRDGVECVLLSQNGVAVVLD